MAIDEQIRWVKSNIRHMNSAFPVKVADGRMKQDQASYLLATAQATLETLTQLRSLVRGSEKIKP